MRIIVSLQNQTVTLIDETSAVVRRYPASTSKHGAGENEGSHCTPRGRHIVRAKIGKGLPSGSVLVGRRPTGEIWTPELHARYPGRDWILSRILWLSGCEPGVNRLGRVDTMRRYIYLHGAPESAAMGLPGSIGCIRMTNPDVMDLFDRVAPYTLVDIDP